MNLSQLPKKVYLDSAIYVLEIADMPRTSALKTILLYHQYDNLPLYSDSCKSIISAEESDIEFIEDNEGFLCTIVDKSNEIHISTDNIRLSDALLVDSPDGRHSIHFSKFSHNGATCFSLSDDNQTIAFTSISTDNVYCDRDELKAFISHLSASSQPPTTPQKASRGREEENLLKALALLARDYADNNTSFRKGSKVSALAIKDLIVTLANQYHVKTYGLNSIDDKLNSVLDDLGLKNIP